MNPKLLPQTCGKCHPGIGTRLGAEFFKIDAPSNRREERPWVVNLVTTIYVLVILLTIGGMAAFVLLDYWRKARDHVRAVKASRNAEERLSPWLKRQHTVLMILFIGLAYTGFVHRFPDAFFSWPFKLLTDGNAVRALLHRIMRLGLRGLLRPAPRGAGGLEGGKVLRQGPLVRLARHERRPGAGVFNLGLQSERPPPRRWNYAEKAEYWALVWGSVVMAMTGIMLIFTEAMLKVLPKVWNDVAQVIHFYEALLATLAILVWHLYWVLFDPSEYPMNPAWIIGKKAGHQGHGGPPAEAASGGEHGGSAEGDAGGKPKETP